MQKLIIEPIHRHDEVRWYVEKDGMKYRITQRKDKHGTLFDKIYVYTNDDGISYYATTALAIFSKKYWVEIMLGVQLKEEEEEEI